MLDDQAAQVLGTTDEMGSEQEAQVSDGSGIRFWVMRGKICAVRSHSLPYQVRSLPQRLFGAMRHGHEKCADLWCRRRV
jgi:hypothetical protein